ncbi:MAG: MlaD family protein [Alphaproteobacteria bacterium]
MERQAKPLVVGSIALGLIAAMMIFLGWLLQVKLHSEGTGYTIYFSESVTGLQIGSPVRFQGVPVGTVSTIALDPANVEHVKVVVELEPSTPVRADSVAMLEVQGITGSMSIQISHGSQSAPLLISQPHDNNGELVIKSQSSKLTSLFEQLPRLLNSLTDLSNRASGFLDEANKSHASSILGNLAQVSQELNLMMPQIRKTFNSLEKTSGALGQNLPALVQDIREQVNILGTDLSATSHSINQTSDSLRQLVEQSKEGFAYFGHSGLYELTGLLVESRELVSGLDAIINKLEQNPRYYLLGDYTDGVALQ